MAIFEHKGIWKDRFFLRRALRQVHDKPFCIYCGGFTLLSRIHGSIEEWQEGIKHFSCIDLALCCDQCGWWAARRELTETVEGEMYRTINGAAGNLYPLADIEDQLVIEDARRELLKNWDEAKGIVHPRKLEQIVEGVFRNFGYYACATAYSNDGGIDVVLERAGQKHGVQVKRYKNKIAVQEIRSFAGALLLNGLPSGVFVTTSDYQRGCFSTTERYEALGLRIELINGEDFFQSLDFNKREPYENWTELFSDGNPELPELVSEVIC